LPGAKVVKNPKRGRQKKNLHDFFLNGDNCA
jgi:hypothetical protein